MARQSPRICVSAVRKLKSLGLSARGIDQLVCGDLVSDAGDRSVLARLLAEWELADRSEPGCRLPPRVGWEVMVRAQSLLKERALAMTDLGIRQLSMGTLVTDPDDRRMIVALLEDATRDAATFARVAARFKNAGGTYDDRRGRPQPSQVSG